MSSHTRESAIRAIRAAATDDVAPGARSWARPAAGRPDRVEVDELFPDGWRELCRAAGLLTRMEAARARARREEREYREKAQAGGMAVESRRERRKHERREVKLAQVAAAVEAGDVVVRTAGPEDLARLDAAREVRERRYVPKPTEMRSVVGGNRGEFT